MGLTDNKNQVRLRNNIGRWSVAGDLVKIDPNDPKGFLIATIYDIGIIGKVIEKKPPRHYCKINTINTVNLDDIVDKPEDFGVGAGNSYFPSGW